MANCQKFKGKLVGKDVLQGSLKAPFSLSGSLPDRTRPTIDSNYQRILNLEPFAFLQFRFPIFQGKQVLWQDAEGTIPVQIPGDNIGRAVCLITGLVMIQTNQSWKPVWDGEKAAFSGSQYLIAENHELGGFLHHHNPCQFVLKSKVGPLPATQFFLSTQSYGQQFAGMNCRFVNDGMLVYNRPITNSTNVGIYVYNTGAMDQEFHPVGYQIRDNRMWQNTKDGARIGSLMAYPESDLGTPQYPLVLGAQIPLHHTGNTIPNNGIVGDVEYLTIYKRSLTQAEQRGHL